MKDFGGNIFNSGITLFGSDSISVFAFDIYIYIYIYIYSRYLLILISHVRVRPGNNPTLLSKNICVICVVPRTVSKWRLQ